MRRVVWLFATVFLLELALVSVCFHVVPSAMAEISQPPFKIRHRVLFSDSPAVWVFAAITNEGVVPVTNVTVSFTFWDNTGEVINQTTEKTILQVLLTNRTTPVFASIDGGNAQRYGSTGRYEVSVEDFDLYPEGRERSLVVNPQSTYLTSEGAYVSGTVINNGSGIVQFLEVTAMFYDEKGFRTSESYPFAMSSNLTQGGETEAFEISSVFATNASEKMACILTVESPERTNQAAYEADQEVLIWLKGGPGTEGEIFDLRWVVLAAVLILVAVGVVALVRRRRQEKAHRLKESGKDHAAKTRMLKPTNFYSPAIIVPCRNTRFAYLGLRGLGCKVYGWSVTILGTA